VCEVCGPGSWVYRTHGMVGLRTSQRVVGCSLCMHHALLLYTLINWRDCSTLIYLAAMAIVALYCTQPCRSTVSCLRLGSSCTPLQYAVECAVAAVSCLEGVRPTLGRVRGHLVITQWPCSLPAPRLDGANARSEHPVWALASKHALCRCGLMHGDDTCREWDLQWQCHLLHTRNVDVLTRTRPCTQDLHCL